VSDEEEREWREEAARLRALPRDVQRQVINLHLATAKDPKATPTARDRARRRAQALARHLGLPLVL
jgi:hypothetical protein